MHAIGLRLVPLALAAVFVATRPQPGPDFNRDVRPILSNHCFKCHGPDARQRKAGLRLDNLAGATRTLEDGRRAVVPGNPAASELVARITNDDPKHRMPPATAGKPLTASQIETLRSWVGAGAVYKRHWSFVTPERPEVPATAHPAWVRNPVDSFVMARLERERLKPSPPADRATLGRRLTLDLTGLPPAAAALDAFVADGEPGAVRRLIDRLLDTGAHAEHMARYWLDAARYGDTHGLHLDNYRSMWPYRDWVIGAYRTNMPYDEFVVEQLAGDLLPHATRSQRIATGFNRCNVTSAEGGMIAEEYLALYAIDRVKTTATVFLGLTAGCAVCHDHKYDPLTQRDFYRMFAFFNSIDESASDGNKDIAPPFVRAPSAEQEAALARIDGEIARLGKAMDAPMPLVDAKQHAWEKEQRARLAGTWHDLRPASVLSRGGADMRVLADGSVLATGTSPVHDVYEVIAPTDLAGITALRLEALPSGEQPGNGIGRAAHSNIVLSSFECEAAAASSPLTAVRVPLAGATAEYEQRGYEVALTLDGKAATGWAIDGRREPLAVIYRAAEPFGRRGGSLLRITLRFESRHGQHTIGRFRLAAATRAGIAPARLGPWSRIGPFRAKSLAAAHARDFGPEHDRDRTRGHGGRTWRPAPQLTDGRVHKLEGTSCATYLSRRIDAPTARPMWLALGSDDAIKVWLNGALVLDRNVTRPAAPDQDKVRVWLEPGANDLLLKVSNGGGGYGFFFRVAGEAADGLPAAVARAVTTPAPTATERAVVRAHFRRRHAKAWRELDRRRSALAAERNTLAGRIPRTMVMKERATPRQAHVLIRGQYDHKAERVEPGTPAALPPLEARGKRATRLDLAHWLVRPDHPLTARVEVNRLWQLVFGRGLVATSEDFGSQGEWPSHPALLDWLARELIDSGWNVRHILTLLCDSETYRQCSRTRSDLAERDPQNRLLARGPRYRLDAEVIRDQALALAGLLNPEVGGPSVKPYQPNGIWKAVGYTSSNTANFKQDHGDKLWRRSIYTFWKRTAAPPTMLLFDAPSREACTVRRARTNTPLQALALLNDVQFVEAARGFATRIMKARVPGARARLAEAFRLCTARRPDATELDTLLDFLRERITAFRRDPSAAAKLVAVGESKPDPALDTAELAGWTLVASLLLNLDATVTKR